MACRHAMAACGVLLRLGWLTPAPPPWPRSRKPSRPRMARRRPDCPRPKWPRRGPDGTNGETWGRAANSLWVTRLRVGKCRTDHCLLVGKPCCGQRCEAPELRVRLARCRGRQTPMKVVKVETLACDAGW